MIALVTGAGGAMGSAIAHRLAAQSAAVAICDISQGRLDQTRSSLAELGSAVSAFRCDVANVDECEALLRHVEEDMGSVNVLVNVVGGYRGRMYESMADISLERFDDVLRRNLRGTFILTQLIAPRMKAAGWGRVINISSVAAYGASGQADYSAAKAGVIALTQSCALEFAPTVNVNAIAPGVIETSVMERIPEEVKSAYSSRIPLGRFGHADDVANCVAFLVSDQADYITGEVINVSGGFRGWM